MKENKYDDKIFFEKYSKMDCFTIDNYFFEGKRKAKFLGEEVIKYHRTLATYLNVLLKRGFDITGIVEPQPSEYLLNIVEGMEDEFRRPMMFRLKPTNLCGGYRVCILIS